jgi:hypothetical protein
MWELNRIIYYYDRIRINSKHSISDLKRILLAGNLKQYCRSFIIRMPSEVARMYCGFKSAIEIIAVKDNRLFIELLKLTDYKISYIELAVDTLYLTEQETLDVFEEEHIYLSKKYTSQCMLYEVDDALSEVEINNIEKEDDEEKYSTKTLYLGSKYNKFAMYSRISKIAGVPCVHIEWRFIGAYNIRKKTGIEMIEDLLDFDIKAFLIQYNTKYLVCEKINHYKHGLFVLSCKKSYVRNYNKNNKKHYNLAVEASHRFFKEKNFNTVAELKSYYKWLQNSLKKKRGRHSYRENKIKALSWIRLKSFFTPLYNNV